MRYPQFSNFGTEALSNTGLKQRVAHNHHAGDHDNGTAAKAGIDLGKFHIGNENSHGQCTQAGRDAHGEDIGEEQHHCNNGDNQGDCTRCHYFFLL
ncbi:hypothetical protein SDC9_88486 [bioreactor metagenome]|uniref:Uncharacterized protein n=1 Tax=bioreactor metagenome TaxID=1076179 RepID=A0A644ZM20_9ZZZZ